MTGSGGLFRRDCSTSWKNDGFDMIMIVIFFENHHSWKPGHFMAKNRFYDFFFEKCFKSERKQ